MRIGIPLFLDELNGRRGWVAGFHYLRGCLAALAMLPPERRPEVHCFLPADFHQPLIQEAPKAPEAPDGEDHRFVVVHRLPASPAGAPALHEDPSRRAEMAAWLAERPVDLYFPIMSPPAMPLPAPAAGWIPDFQHHRLPEFFDADERRLRGRIFTFLTAYCQTLACSSRTVMADLAEFYPQAQAKARLLHFRCALPKATLDQSPEAALERLGVREPFIYLPNQFWVHKNHRLAFEAWRILRDASRDAGQTPLLVCTGNPHDYRAVGHHAGLEAFLDEHGLRERVRLLGFIDRADQVALYRGAAAVLQPSLFEGWSTSIEEARCLGKSLLLSDLPIHREQCPQGRFFPARDPEALAALVRESWPDLPRAWNPVTERQAFEDYALLCRQFGEDALALWKDCREAGAPEIAQDQPFQDRSHLAGLWLEQGAELDACVHQCQVRLRRLEEYKDEMRLQARSYKSTIRAKNEEIQRALSAQADLRARIKELDTPRMALKIVVASALRKAGLGFVVERHGRRLKRLAMLPIRAWRSLRAWQPGWTGGSGGRPAAPAIPSPLPGASVVSPLVEALAMTRAFQPPVQGGLPELTLEKLHNKARPEFPLLCLRPTPRTIQAMLMYTAAGAHCACLGCDEEMVDFLYRHGILGLREDLFGYLAASRNTILAGHAGLLWEDGPAPRIQQDLELLRGRLWPHQELLCLESATGVPGAERPVTLLQEAPQWLFTEAPDASWLDPCIRNANYYRLEDWPEAGWFPIPPETMPSGEPWPRISVVTVSLNQGRYIEETILSVLNQWYPNLEYIIQDACSTDETPAILERYRDRIAHLTIEKDRGQSDALNRGFAKATGDILCWLNADDRLLPGALFRVAMAMRQGPPEERPDMVAGGVGLVQVTGKTPTHVHHCKMPPGQVAPLPCERLLDVDGAWQKGDFFYQPEVFWTRDLWERAGGRVDEGLHYSMDYELWVRFARQGARILHIPDTLVLFRVHPDQKTNMANTQDQPFLPELRRVADEFKHGKR